MFTLPENLMLLALHDEKGHVLMNASTALPYGLGGALMMELFFLKKITLVDKKLRVIDTTPTGDVLLDSALTQLGEASKPRTLKWWIGKMGQKKLYRELTLDGLVARQVLRRQEKKVLWVFNVKRFPTEDERPEKQLRQHIHELVLGDSRPDERDIALLSLVKACDLIAEIFERPDRKEAKKRVKEMTDKEVVGKLVSVIVAEITAAVAAGVMAATIASTASH